MRRLLVTGASGFVGGAVARAAVAAGWEVVTTSRRPAAVPGATHVPWDLDLPAPPGLGEVDAVVHAGAYVGETGPAHRVRRTTVDGTRRLLDATPARVVHVSTASVYDPFRPSVRAHESEAPVSRYLGAYAAAKAEAERLVLGSGRPAVVLRPHAVYGPGDTTLLPRVLGAVRGGRLVLPGGGRELHHLTAVGTLVDACLRAAEVPLTHPVVVNVADAEPVVLREALVEVLARRGTEVEVRAVPVRAAWRAAAVAEGVSALTGHRWVPPLTRYAVSHLGLERTYDLAALREVLGLDPAPTDLRGAAAW